MADERSAKSATYLSGREIHTEWESDYLNADLDDFYDAAFDRIVEALGARPGQRVLDAGCGYGFHLMRLARKGLHVTGADFSQTALDHARTNLERTELAANAELVQCNILELPFEDDTFDHVSCWGVLMHIPELEQALTELARVLSPGGRLALMENNRHSFHVAAWERTTRVVKSVIGRKVYPRLLTSRGLEEWRERPDGGLMVRKSDPDFIKEFMASKSLRLVDRFPGQFTELYTALPSRGAKRVIHRFNRFYFKRKGPPQYAMGNIFIFEKNAGVG